SRRRISKVLGPVPMFSPQGFFNYNALTLNVEKRFSGEFSLLANYTWSRALGVAPGYSAQINNTALQDPTNLNREYGTLDYDIKNRVSIAHVYELPFGKGKCFLSQSSRALDLMLGGWQVNGISSFPGRVSWNTRARLLAGEDRHQQPAGCHRRSD